MRKSTAKPSKPGEPSVLTIIAPGVFALGALGAFGAALSEYRQDQIGLASLILAPLVMIGFAWLAWKGRTKGK